MPNNGKTQHQKLDELLGITTDIRIKQGVFEERLNNAKEQRTEMKEEIDKLENRKKVQTVWDGINSFAILLWVILKDKLPL